MAAITLPIEGAASAAPELGHILSPSQVTTFTDCPARWYAKYALGIPDPKNSNLALGIAVHDALAANFHLKQETGCDLPAEDALIEFDASWAMVEADTEFRDDEKPKEIQAAGRKLVELYLRDAAPAIKPQAVEVAVEGIIGGVCVQGKLDLIDQHGVIRDIKTSSKKSSTISMNHTFQMATYALLIDRPDAKVQVDQLVKTKTPQLVQIQRQLTGQDIRAAETMYPLAQDAMRSGYYMPNRSSMLCSRKNCSAWRWCEDSFGGQVAGAEAFE